MPRPGSITADKWLQIISALKEIEEANAVSIMFAIESGSRAWGFESPNSDYDVRFIYRRHKNDYLSLTYSADDEVIEDKLPGDIDVSGWDIRKALKLGLRSNPSLIEWVNSPIEYVAGWFAYDLREVITNTYCPNSGICAYWSMARGNYVKYIEDMEIVSYKRYLYVVRPLLTARWIQQHQCPLPVLFDAVRETGNQALDAEIETLLQMKISGQEMGEGPRLPVIDKFIEDAMSNPPGRKPTVKDSAQHLPAYQELLFKYIG
jgi:predicted nucleotidyltransferase